MLIYLVVSFPAYVLAGLVKLPFKVSRIASVAEDLQSRAALAAGDVRLDRVQMPIALI